VNLSNEDEFITAVSKDSRSFKKALFLRAEKILSKWGLASNEFIAKLVRFADLAESKKLEEEEEELELGEIPDEFLDPLMFTLMKDPVILPSSKISIDRSTIRAHLLSDSTDPFNRMPLKLEDILPDNELRIQIEEFKRNSKANKTNNDNDVQMNDA
jgi:ubiquitin conjugation factor E4 B